MSEIYVLDLAVVGKELGVPEKEVTPPFPNAKPMLQQVWTDEYVFKLIDYAKENIKPKGGVVSLLGHVEMWIAMALAHALRPECDVRFASPNHDENNTFTHLPAYDVKYGEPTPGYSQTVEEKGDYLYIDYTISEDIPWNTLLDETLPNLVLPEIPQGKKLVLAANAHYPLQWVVMNAYARGCSAMFSNDHGSPNYRCSYSVDPAVKVGDTYHK